jgi:hypothetical protein
VEIEVAKKRQGALLRKTRQETHKLCKEKRCVTDVGPPKAFADHSLKPDRNSGGG